MQATTFAADYGIRFERAVIWLLLNDADYAATMYAALSEEHFETADFQIIFEHAKVLYDAHAGQITSIAVLGELNSTRKKLSPHSPRRVEYDQAIKRLAGMKEPKCTVADLRYVQLRTQTFITRARVRDALLMAADEYERNDFDAILAHIEDAVNGGNRNGHTDLGISFDSVAERLQLYVQRASTAHRSPLNVPTIDHALRGGLEAGNLGLIMAPANRGKSLLLLQAAATALNKKLNVALVTLELLEADYAQRFDAHVTGIPINEIHSNTRKHLLAIMGKAKKQFQGRLFIKKFQEDITSVADIVVWLKSLKAQKQFVPDVLVVDYLDLLRHERKLGERPDIGITARALRRLGGELNMSVWSATQSRRSSYNANHIHLHDVAEDIQKVHVADAIIGMAQTDKESEKQEARLYVLKNRQGGRVDSGRGVFCSLHTPTMMCVEKTTQPRGTNRP